MDICVNFSVDCQGINGNLMKNNVMFGFIKKVLITLLSFSGSLLSMANLSSFTTCMFLNNPPCII